MSQQLAQAMRREALRVLSSRAQPRIAIVSDFDPKTYSVKVRVGADMDAGDFFETDWIPVSTPWLGSAWGLFAPLAPGDQVVVVFADGEYSGGVVVGGIFSEEQASVEVPAGEFWLVHSTGSSLKFQADGHVNLNVPGDLGVTVTGDLGVTVTGNVSSSAAAWNHTGNLTVAGVVSGATVQEGSVVLGSHIHGNGNNGSNTTGPT